MKIRIGSRRSDLAKIQAFEVARVLKERNPTLEIEHVFKQSLGDLNLDDDLARMPEKGVFTKDLTQDLLDSTVDLVVHSWKDLPTQGSSSETVVAASLPREDPRDLLILKESFWKTDFDSTRPLRVLTGSPRRRHQVEKFVTTFLPRKISQVEFLPLRGNIPTRLRKWKDNAQADAVVFAKAALDRMLSAPQDEFRDIREEILEILGTSLWCVLPLSEVPTAPAQGALALEIRKSDTVLAQLLEKIHAPATVQLAEREREELVAFGGGCALKLGVTALDHRWGFLMWGKGESPDGRTFEKRVFRPRHLKPRWEGHRWDRKQILLPGDPGYPKFRRVRNPGAVEPVGSHVFVTKSDALPMEWKAQGDSFLWTAGTSTWRALSERGLWVHGTFDSLGESEGVPLSPKWKEKPWVKVTHDKSPSSLWAKNLATYFLEIEKGSAKLSPEIQIVFWSSFSAFEGACAQDPSFEKCLHACGVGHSADAFAALWGAESAKWQVFLDEEDFLEKSLHMS